MYAIATVVYGVPWDRDVEAIANWKELSLEQLGWTELYSGTADFGPGYLGVELATLDETGNFSLLDAAASGEGARLTPTKAEREQAEALVAAQPAELQAGMAPPAVYLIWSTS